MRVEQSKIVALLTALKLDVIAGDDAAKLARRVNRDADLPGGGIARLLDQGEEIEDLELAMLFEQIKEDQAAGNLVEIIPDGTPEPESPASPEPTVEPAPDGTPEPESPASPEPTVEPASEPTPVTSVTPKKKVSKSVKTNVKKTAVKVKKTAAHKNGKATKKPVVKVKKTTAHKNGKATKPPLVKRTYSDDSLSQVDAAYVVLLKSKEPMSLQQMVNECEQRRLYKSNAAMPAKSLCRGVIMDMRKGNSKTKFKKVSRGLFVAIPGR